MKNIIVIIILWFCALSIGHGQAFVQLSNASGYEYTQVELDSLEAATQRLIEILPEEFQSQFKVFDFGYYAYNELMEGGSPAVWHKAISEARSKARYYILFGREIDSSGLKKYKVELKFPNEGIFSCSTTLDNELLISKLFNELNKDESFNGIISSMRILRMDVNKKKECCTFSRSNCETCKSSEEVDILFKNRGALLLNRESSLGNYSMSDAIEGNYNIQTSYLGQSEAIGIAMERLDSILSSINLTFKSYITSNNSTCIPNFVENIDALYSNSDKDVALRLHFDEEAGKVYELLDYSKIVEYYDNEILDKYEVLAQQLGGNEVEDVTAGCKENILRMVTPTIVDYTDNEYSKVDGLLAHAIIQSYYKIEWAIPFSFSNNPAKIEYSIPYSSALGNTGYADIVNLFTREIFEIKSVKSVPAANEEVKRYVDQANLYCVRTIPDPNPELPFVYGQGFPEKVKFPFPPKRILTAYKALPNVAPKGGVISYRITPDFGLPTPEPILIPNTSWEKIAQKLKELTTSPTPYNTAWTFFNENREIIYFVAVVGLGAIVVNGIATYVSAGSASPATIPLMISAGILVTTALTFDPNSPPSAGT